MATMRVPGGPDCMDITPDGKELWVTQRFLRRIAIVDLAHAEGRRQHSGRQVAARRVHPQGARRTRRVRAAANELAECDDEPLIDLWVGAQTWLFETLVSPVLFALNLMEWFEPAFNAVEFVMLGVVQIAVIALVMRLVRAPLGRRAGRGAAGRRRPGLHRAEQARHRAAAGVRRGLSDHQRDRAPGAGHGLRAAAARAADPRPARQRASPRSWSTSCCTTSPPTGCIAPSTASAGGGRCTACITASAG